MELEGIIWKSKKQWLVEVPALDLMTQGKSCADAIKMIQSAILELVSFYFEGKFKVFTIAVTEYNNGIIGVSGSDTKLLLALSLRRQREKSGLTVREVASRLGSQYPNAYAQYERGGIKISLDQYERLLNAVNPSSHRLIQVI